MFLFIKVPHSVKVTRRIELVHGVVMVSFFSELNLLIVNGIDVLNRTMTLLKATGNWSTDCLGDLVFGLWRRPRFRFEGFQDGCGSGVKDLFDTLTVFWLGGGVKVDVELDSVAGIAMRSIHMLKSIIFIVQSLFNCLCIVEFFTLSILNLSIKSENQNLRNFFINRDYKIKYST